MPRAGSVARGRPRVQRHDADRRDRPRPRAGDSPQSNGADARHRRNEDDHRDGDCRRRRRQDARLVDERCQHREGGSGGRGHGDRGRDRVDRRDEQGRSGVSATAAITVPAALDLTPNYGNFNITATKTTDTGCAFVATFAGQVNINGNKDGTALAIRMIERLTRIYAGTMQSDGRYSGTGTGNLDGFTYNGSIAGAVSANSLTG